MADNFSADWGELNELVGSFTESITAAPAEIGASMRQASFATRDVWRAHAKANVPGGVATQYSATIDFEMKSEGVEGGAGSITSDIGPNIDRYGGETGKGGLLPSMGILDDPQSGRTTRHASRSRWEAMKFAEKELPERMQRAIDETLKKAGL